MSADDTGRSPAATVMRLKGLVRKETLQILRDPSSIAIAFVLPVILLLLFGYGVSLDAKRVPLAVVVESPSAEASSLVASLQQSPYFAPRLYLHRQQAEAAAAGHHVWGVLVLRADFARRLLDGGNAPIQLLLNGTDANTARLVSGYVQGAWLVWLQQYALDHGRELQIPVKAEPRVWFNAEVRSRNYLVPGLIAIIMTLIGALLTAMVVAREWERGTMEALMVSPVRVGEILLGKLIPYFVLGMGGMLLATAMAVWQFHVPLRGSLGALAVVSALFMLVALGMGLLISTVARSQFVAGQIAIITTFLPAFILSGFVFDIASMPAVVQAITHIVPARYFVSALQTLFLAGDVWPIIRYDSIALVIMAVLFLGITLRKTRKRLD